MVRLSPSSLSLFTECPRCFWFRMKMNIKRPSTIFPSLPGGMDRILKKHFDAHRRNSTLPGELTNIEGIEGSLFSDPERLKDWRNNFRGLRHTDPETGATLMGALDDLFVTSEGKYAPLDFKTRGYPLKEDTHTHYQDQMNIYSFLLEKNSLPPADFAILVFYYPNQINEHGKDRENRENHANSGNQTNHTNHANRDVTFDSEVKKIPTDPNNAENLFRRAVKTLQSPAPPEPSKDCEFCRWLGDVNGYQHEHNEHKDHHPNQHPDQNQNQPQNQETKTAPTPKKTEGEKNGLGKWM